MSHKSFNLVKEWARYEVFGVRGFSVWNLKPYLPHLSHVCLFIYNNNFYHIIKTILSHDHNMFKKRFEPSPFYTHSKALTRSNHHFMTQLGWGGVCMLAKKYQWLENSCTRWTLCGLIIMSSLSQSYFFHFMM
jgi:hypothetical protein